MEINSVKTIDDVNWYGLISSGRDKWKSELNNSIKIPQKFYDQISRLMVSLTSDLRDSFEKDVISGQLSQATMKKFNDNFITSIIEIGKDNVVNSEIQKIPITQRKLAKSVGRGKIKDGVNKTLTLTGQKFFKEGFGDTLKQVYDVKSPIIKNYIKVSNQMGDFVMTNKPLEDYLYNFILNKL